MSRITELVIAVAVIVALGIGIDSYVKAREDRAKLQAELDSGKALLAHLDADQKQRDADLQAKFKDLEASKVAVAKMPPAQQVQAITKVIPLPFAMNVQQQSDPITGKLREPQVVMPVANLKPLYDYGANCQECQDRAKKLAADLEAGKQREALITKERDDAVRAAKGTFWQHVSGSKWLKLIVFAGGVYAGQKLAKR